MVRSLTRRGMPKPFAILLAMLMALYFVPIGALPASAAVPDFEIDGNQKHDAAEDWKDLTVGAMPDSGGKTNRSLTTFVDNTTSTGGDSTVFGSNNKEEPPGGVQWPNWVRTDNGNATGKSDYGRVASYSYVQNDHVFLVLGFDRGSNPQGNATANYYFELNQKAQSTSTNPNPVRTVNDIRINLNDDGSNLFTATVQKWNGSTWVAAPSAGDYKIAANTATISDLAAWWTPSLNAPGGSITPEGFIETSFDLTSFGVVLGCPASGFTTLNGRSTTGESAKNLVDYFEAQPISVPSTCASLYIKKFKGDGKTTLGGATFKVEPNPLPEGAPGRPAADFLTIFDDSDGNTAKEGSTNYDDPDARAGVITIPGVKPGIEYTITEISAPDGWIKDDGVVKRTPEKYGTDATATNTATFVNTLGSVRFAKKDAVSGQLVCCATFRVQGTGGAAQTLGVDITVTDNGTGDLDPDDGQVKLGDLPTGTYTVTETVAPQGYDLPPANDRSRTFTISAADPDPRVSSAFQDPRASVPLKVKKVAENAQGTVIAGAVFELWRESGQTAGLQRSGADADAKVGQCTTGADGTCTVAGATWHNSYYWYEVSVPAPYNLPNQRVQGPIEVTKANIADNFATTVFADPRSKIVTQATNGSLPNATISDTATLSGVNDSATGTVTFDLYYTGATEPTKDSCVPANVVATGIAATAAVDGPGEYTTGPVDVTKAGYYTWVAHYSGDANGNLGVSGECDDVNETSIVVAAEPGIVTVVPQSSVDLSDAPTKLTDSATLSGASGNATGAVTFSLYGPFASQPGANDCTSGKLVQTVGSVETFSGNGSYTSLPVTVTSVGFYTWKATYTSGDANNKDATHACGQANETVEVGKAAPSITTEAQQTEVTLGSQPTSLTDKAKLSGATSDAGGSVTFSLYGPFAQAPGAASCTDGKLVKTVDVDGSFSGNGTYTSLPVVVSKAGYYTWVAVYSGDANNKKATHACGQAEETTRVLPAKPTITTDAGDDVVIGANGATLKDDATLSGATADASGTITFKLYGPFSSDPTGNGNACVDDGAGKNLVGTVTNADVDGNDTYTSPGVSVSTTGYYVWVASYSGDDDNATATHPCGVAAEVVRVTPRQPSITTEVPDRVVTLGANGVALTDTATLSQATSTAGGTISFQLYGPFQTRPGAGSCDGNALGGPVGTTNPVSGNGSYSSMQKTVTVAGFYTWIATYSGDADNKSATHACGLASETVEVEKAPTSITTEVSEATTQLAPTASLVDTATLSGATVTPAAGGTISFTLYGPFDSDPTDAQGDSDVCTAGNAVKTVGTTAPVSGPGSYTSAAVTVAHAGWYVWLATYSGDANNEGSTHGCGDAKEVTQVGKAAPAITTQVPSATARLAPTVVLTDSAMLTGATTDPAAKGSITFSLYGPFASDPGSSSCTTGTLVGTRSASVDGPGAYSPSSGIRVSEVGFYTWVAAYSGDANNKAATHACGLSNETVEVLKTRGQITTDAVDDVRLSSGKTTISDEATLTGVTRDPAASGTIEFKVYGPFASQPDDDDCSQDKLVGGGPYTVAVDGPGEYTSPDVQVKQAGYYVWVARYSGDANNEPATHPCGQTEETTRVDKAIPSVDTQVAAASVELPSASLVDTATLSGGTTDPKATGTITFGLYGPFASAPGVESCDEGSLVATRVVTVTNGNGSYVSPAVTVGAAGYYTWVAVYSGDANNEAATHPCGAETETVVVEKAPTSVSTVATSQAVIKLGQTISDAASVTGLTSDATGTVRFDLYGPGDADCSGTPAFTSTVALVVTPGDGGTGTGAATSAAFTPTLPGTYRWIASYSGDGNNAVSAGKCNDPNEQSVVFAGDNPGLDKFSDPASGSAVQPGSTINYSVKVSNTGDVAITDAEVVDILPPHVTVVSGSISDGGVLSADASRITWKVTLAAADPQSNADEKTLTYKVTVNANAPQGAVLVNTARFQGLQDTTTHVVPTGDLTVLKAVTPVAGGGVVVGFGDELTYTLSVTATGALNQTSVVVTDYVPGSDPARPDSGSTTYVPGSAACVGAGTCAVTEPGADGLVTWSLGSMAAGTTRQVTFKVTIDEVAGEPGETVAVDILNAGAVASAETPKRPSNEVVTPVTAVFPVKVGTPPAPGVLPRTGSSVQPGLLAGTAVALLGLGLLLMAATRRRGAHARR